MHEIVVLGLVALQLGLAYGFVYPKFAGDNPSRLQWLDVLTKTLVLGVVAVIYARQDLAFSLIFFDTEWWIFTIVVSLIGEIPLYLRYTRQRKMKIWNSSKIYWIEGITENEVTWALSDTKYNRIRTRNARFLLVSLNAVAIGSIYASAFLGGYPKLATYLEGIGLISGLVLYFLLRSSVRSVADAPDELLDERQIAVRNRAYLLSFRTTMYLLIFGLLFMQIAGLEMKFFGDPSAGVVDGGALVLATVLLMGALPSIFVAVRDKGEDDISMDVSAGGNRL